MDVKRLTLGIALALTIGSSRGAEEKTITAKCQALAESNGGLYLVHPSKSYVQQLSRLGRARFATLSPSGEQVVFASSTDPVRVAILDTGGAIGPSELLGPNNVKQRSSSKASAGSEDGELVGLAWNGPQILRVAKHVNPTTNRFDFYSVPTGASRNARKIAGPAFGSACAMSPTRHEVACIVGDTLRVGEKIILSDMDASKETVVDTFELAVGSEHALTDIPGMSISLKSITQGMTLSIAMPTEGAMQSRIETAGVWPIALEDREVRLKPTLLGNGLVRVVASQVLSEEHTALVAVAWGDDDTIYLGSSSSQRNSLIYLSGSSSPRRWKVVAARTLPVRSVPRDIQAVSPAGVVVTMRGDSSANYVPVQRGLGKAPRFGTPLKLPPVVLPTASSNHRITIRSWACDPAPV
jgi:hypothetical protein